MVDEVQARIDADYELAPTMTQEEQEKYTIEERARLLAEFFERRKKQLAAERAEAIRIKQPTKTQLRNLMMTYLKNTGDYKHSELKGKTYEEIHELYERQQKRIQDFIPMDSEKEVIISIGKKMEGRGLVDPIILSAKYPVVDWESQNLGNVDMEDLHVYKIIKADGNTSYHKSLSSYNLLLWGDLKSSLIAYGWYSDLLQHASREKYIGVRESSCVPVTLFYCFPGDKDILHCLMEEAGVQAKKKSKQANFGENSKKIEGEKGEESSLKLEGRKFAAGSPPRDPGREVAKVATNMPPEPSKERSVLSA
ncbi:hypothetical protein Tco_0012351 [Tanacetum coccineum]